MSEDKTRLVPRLRFPEFREAGEWEEKPLGPYLESYSERVSSADTELPIYSSTREGLKLQKDYYDGREIANEGEYGVVPAGYFVYRHMSDDLTFKFNINDTAGQIAVSKEYPVFRTLYLNSRFLLFTLNEGREFKRFAETQRKGGTRTRLYFNVLRECSILLPLLSEQQKIAACLSSLDALIAAQADKLDALKTHKKGLMQQLFPREGETVPRLRFPEFRGAGEWEKKTVGDVGQVVTGSTPSTGKPEYYGGNIAFVSPADISDLRFVEKTKTSLTELGFAQSRPVPAYSILFVCIGSTIGKVAQNVSRCATNQQINSVVPHPAHDAAFAYYLLISIFESIAKLAGKQAVPIVNKTLFSSVSLLLPKLDEQQRIAACLSSLDTLIAAQADKLDALKAHKKGLMQQLFPSPAGVAA